MSKKTKFNFKGGLQSRLIGSAAGGAASALFDSYITPHLPNSMQPYPDVIKIGAGVVLPMVVKGNQLVSSLSDGLLTVGVSNLLKEKVFKTAATSGVGNANAPFPLFAARAKYVGDAAWLPGEQRADSAKRSVGELVVA